MAWFPIALTDDEQRIVNAERDVHPEAHVRRKMLVLWLLHCKVTRVGAATIAGLGRATVTVIFHPPVHYGQWGSRKALADHCFGIVRNGVNLANGGKLECEGRQFNTLEALFLSLVGEKYGRLEWL